MTWVSLRWLKTSLYMAYTLDSVHKVKKKKEEGMKINLKKLH